VLHAAYPEPHNVSALEGNGPLTRTSPQTRPRRRRGALPVHFDGRLQDARNLSGLRGRTSSRLQLRSEFRSPVPWNSDRAGGSLAPRNGVTGRRYRGINVLLVGNAGFVFGPDPRWMTYRQAAERGWQVRKGSRGARIFFYRQLEVGDDDAREGEGGAHTRRHIP